MTKNLVKLTVISVAVLASMVFSLRPSGAFSTGSPTGSGVVQEAAALFGQKCVICHGKDGKGTPTMKSKGVPNFTDPNWQKAHSDAEITETIYKGKGKTMPSFKGKLTDAQIAALLGHVRAFGKH
ncbi:MAG TPA: c-type cytochrome [Blastocatellia bacterium]|nr:c-type cytochrome [Blastocatellia bacterium]